MSTPVIKGKRKAVRVKTSLNNPYDYKWRPLEKGQARVILNTVTDKFSSLDLRKRHVTVRRNWGSRRRKGKCASVDTKEPAEEKEERGWTDKERRTELAIGINEVTKGLERNELGLVLVCNSVKPSHMTDHLISLSQSRSVPACQLPGLSATLSPLLGLTSVLAIGFKRQSHAFVETIADIAAIVPPLGVAWVPGGAGVSSVEVCEETEARVEGEEDQVIVRKRKREEDSPDVTLLQPLKVKKIIPNPLKVRKVKKKSKQK